MINVDEAKKIIEKEFPNNIIASTYEFKDFYVFNLTNKKKEILLDSNIGVYKKDGKVFVFNPLTSEETGKLVEIWHMMEKLISPR